jgi:DNA-binding phage protein
MTTTSTASTTAVARKAAPRPRASTRRGRRPAFHRGFPREKITNVRQSVSLAFSLARLKDLDLRTLAKRTGLPDEVLERVRSSELLLPAPQLAGLLRMCGLDEPTVRETAEIMQFLDDVDVVRIFRPKSVWLSDDEQDITTPAELAAVLNAVARRSGIPLKYLAVATGISRAQLYSLTGNERMPRNADQLISLLSVSGLTAEDIEHVLWRWRQLRANALVTRLAYVGAEKAAPSAAGSAKPSIARTWARFRALFAGDRPSSRPLPLS